MALVIARLQEKLNLANQRGFTRTAAWISHIAQLLPNIAPALATEFIRSHGGNRTAFTYTLDLAKSSLAASPLANLVGMAGSLARTPSLQPANALRLGRTVAKSFGPQSDIAPRLLANFHPTAAPSLYGAWKSVAKPYGWVEVQAARVQHRAVREPLSRAAHDTTAAAARHPTATNPRSPRHGGAC